VDLYITPLFITLQKKQAAEPYSNFVKARSSFNGPEKVSLTLGLEIFQVLVAQNIHVKAFFGYDIA